MTQSDFSFLNILLVSNLSIICQFQFNFILYESNTGTVNLIETDICRSGADRERLSSARLNTYQFFVQCLDYNPITQISKGFRQIVDIVFLEWWLKYFYYLLTEAALTFMLIIATQVVVVFRHGHGNPFKLFQQFRGKRVTFEFIILTCMAEWQTSRWII